MPTPVPPPVSTRCILVLLSASLLSLVLGSVHAFSVFLEPLETRFDASRSSVSLIYSFALVFLTLAVLAGHRVFSRLSAGPFIAVICLLAATGTLIAAYAPSLVAVWLGYSVLFGVANGLGYGFGLQIAAQANPGREGLAMGIVTACYAVGATVAPALFSWAMSAGGFASAMTGLSITLVLIAPVCSGLMFMSGMKFKSKSAQTTSAPIPHRQIGLLWLGYGAGVAAGLMAIGHATGIAKSSGLERALWIAPMIIAVCNMFGSLAGGWLVDRVRLVWLFVGLPALSGGALFLLAVTANRDVTLICLGIVGFAYGAIISVYPATIAKMFGTMESTRIYGRVFTAWGAAGLIAPWLAGLLFDRTGGYAPALLTAAALGAVSAVAAIILFRDAAPGAGSHS